MVHWLMLTILCLSRSLIKSIQTLLQSSASRKTQKKKKKKVSGVAVWYGGYNVAIMCKADAKSSNLTHVASDRRPPRRLRVQQDRRWRRKLQNKVHLGHLTTQRTDVADPSVPAVWGTGGHNRCEYLWIKLMSVWDDDAAPKFCHSALNTHPYPPPP